MLGKDIPACPAFLGHSWGQVLGPNTSPCSTKHCGSVSGGSSQTLRAARWGLKRDPAIAAAPRNPPKLLLHTQLKQSRFFTLLMPRLRPPKHLAPPQLAHGHQFPLLCRPQVPEGRGWGLTALRATRPDGKVLREAAWEPAASLRCAAGSLGQPR